MMSPNPPLSIFRVLLLCISCLLVSSCTRAKRPCASCPTPRIDVFVMPAAPVHVSGQSLLIAPVRTPRSFDAGTSHDITRILQETFLQQRVFEVAELAAPVIDAGPEHWLKVASSRRFDFVMTGEMPYMLPASGISPGKVAIALTITSTHTGSSLWRMLAETELKPIAENHSVLFPGPYVPPPTLSQGIVALARSIAEIITCTSGTAATP